MKLLSQFVASTIAIALGASALVADDADDLRCIAEKVVITDIEVVGSRGNLLDYRYRVTNHLPFAIGGASVEVTVNAKNRPVYLERNTSDIAATIAGGLMPDETMVLDDTIRLSNRSMMLAGTIDNISADFEVKNIADETMTRFRAGPWSSNWSPGPSTHICEQF